ncbi:unnamed protein product, partial [Phaeothamnion confervicola]
LATACFVCRRFVFIKTCFICLSRLSNFLSLLPSPCERASIIREHERVHFATYRHTISRPNHFVSLLPYRQAYKANEPMHYFPLQPPKTGKMAQVAAKL